MEWKKGNTFGLTAFVSYGSFWLTLTILFFLLAIGELTSSAAVVHFAGYEGVVCGASAIYVGIAQVFNELYEETIFPLG